MMDLSTHYMGIPLETPLIASSSPLTRDLNSVQVMAENGISAVVLPSLFEEQIGHPEDAMDYFLSLGGDDINESLGYLPHLNRLDPSGSERYLDMVKRFSEKLSIPVFASLNGISPSGWTAFAKQLQEAGAAGIELNVYHIPLNFDEDGRQVEARYIKTLKAIKAASDLPVALKISPFFSAFGHFSKQLEKAGADALVLFNRFMQPDIGLKKLELDLKLDWSSTSEIRLPLRWLAMLSGKLDLSLAGSRGVKTHKQVAKYLLAGADVAMVTGCLLEKGPEYAGEIIDGLKQWMLSRDFKSVDSFKGMVNETHVFNSEALARVNYMRMIDEYEIPVR